MFDCGIKLFGRHKRILNQLRRDGLKPENIGKIFITHAHADHMNAIDFFKENYNPEVILPAMDKERFIGGYEYEIQEIIKDANKFNLKPNEILPAPPKIMIKGGNYSMGKMPVIEPDRLINGTTSETKNAINNDQIKNDDGEIIKGSKYSIKAIPTPGHTKGHTCYYIPELCSMIGGDIIDPTRNDKASLNYADVDYDDYLNSLNKLLEFEKELFLAMHAKRVHFGTVVNDIRTNIALLHMDNEKEKVIGFLKEKKKKGATIKDFKGLYPVGKFYELTDSKSIPFIIIKSLHKEELIRQEGNRFFLKNKND